MKRNDSRIPRRLAALSAAAVLLVLSAPVAYALDCSGKPSSMDMSTWENVLRALYLFAGAGFFTAVVAALKTGKLGGIKNAFAVLLALVSAAAPALDKADSIYTDRHPFVAASPAANNEYACDAGGLADDADFYVSPEGDDANDGSFAHPFRTPERARDAVRALDRSGKSGVTVALLAGEYRINGLTFTAADSGTAECPVTWRAYGDGEAVFNGGVSLSPGCFTKLTDAAQAARLHGDAKSKVLVADLFALGLTKEDYGKIYTIGTYHTAGIYSGDYTGPIYSELFVNDNRCRLARYPDEGFLYTGEVTAVNGGRFLTDGSANPAWGAEPDPMGETFRVDEALAARIAGWQTFDDVWMMGFWKYDWADGSTLIGGFAPASRELTMRFASFYGAKENAPYWFFNVFEELDSPGEWYLDRDNGLLYLYPPEDFDTAAVDMSLSTAPVVTANGVSYLTFENITLKGTRGNGMQLSGDHIVVRGCTVKNTAGTAIIADGAENLVTDCEIARTGRGGIYLSGGDTATLTPGNNRAVNNLIHDWSEIYRTYQPGVSLYGVGNVCEHNEFYNSPHEAITYGGNDHRIAYNRIGRVCLTSSDAGAIYAGRSWTSYGNEILYNCIYDLGSGDYTPCGIYMDDALSGQKIYGNLLVNIPGYALHLGGGRDLDVRNNVIVSGGQRGISYDQRAYDGVYGGWFAEHSGPDGNMWADLRNSPWKTETWQNAYPAMAAISDDFNNPDDPAFAANPAGSVVADNLFVTGRRTLGEISERALAYSDFHGNSLFRREQLRDLFADPANGDYTLREDAPVFTFAPHFEPLPVSQMGRQSGQF
ncbi:MAG: right-handed parallel beta-helix repeat-containing protein [Clostridia bacterium]|nr:right-handed parallel beta-helix repeat-containing protein [Clostridia bacterium]